LRQLIPCLGPEFSLIQGRIGTDVTVQGNLSGGLRINESLSLTDAMLWPALAEGASKALPKLTGTYDLTVDMARALVEMAAQLHLVSLQATMKGTVHNVRTIPQFDLHLTTNRFAPGELLAPLPILMPMLPTLAVPRASVQLQATLEGTPHNRHAEAEIDLDNITLKGGFFNGGMQDGGGRFLETDKTHATLTVDLMQPQPPNVQMDIRAQRLVFDQQAAKASAPSTDMPSGRTPRVVSSSHSP